MQRKLWAWLAIVLLTLAMAVLGSQYIRSQTAQMSPGMMRGSGGMMGNPRMVGDAQTIHQLFAEHDRIRRTVTNIPGGIRAVTESDDPQLSALIQSHVSRMYERVNQGQPIPMIGMSSTLPDMVQAANQYQRKIQLTPKGISVAETTTDPKLEPIIRAHGLEVTQFIEHGMSAMMNGRTQ